MTQSSEPDPATSEAINGPSVVQTRLGALLRVWRKLQAPFKALFTHPVVAATTSLLVFLIALKVINAELSKSTLQDLERTFNGVDKLSLLTAIAAVSICYAALTLNDRFALSMLGKRLARARTVRASFAAYALSNTLGYAWATAGTARLRLYRKWGLMPNEIGALSFITGTSVQIGGLAAAGIGLLLAAPEVAVHGPLNATFWYGVGLVALVPAVLWLRYAQNGHQKTNIAGAIVLKPPTQRAFAHLAAIVLNWIGAAGVLYFLLPDHGGWSFPAFLAVYVLAGMLGAISGAPGGLGVFEAAILTLAPVTLDTPGAAVALIIYRLLYNIVPLGMALIILGLDHAAPAARPAVRVAKRVGSKVGANIGSRMSARLGSSLSEATLEFSPRLLSTLVFAAGVILLASVATPSLTERIKLLDNWDLHAVSELSHFGASIVGVALLIVASGLWRKVNTAWASALVLLAAGIIFSLIKGLDWEEASALAVVFAIMLPCRSAFNRNSRLGPIIVSPGWIAAMVGTIAASSWLALFAYQHVDFRAELWWEFVRDRDAARTLRALTAASVLTLLVAVWTLVRPLRARQSDTVSAIDIERVNQIVTTARTQRADTNLAFLGDKNFVFSDSGNSFIMFRPRGNRWVAYGDPVGSENERQELLIKMNDASDQSAARPVYYAVSRACVADFAAFGYGVRKIGETAVVNLTQFELVGKAAQNWRTARNKMTRDGCVFSVIPPDQINALMPELQIVSDTWLNAHKGSEKTFSLGAFDPAYLARFPTAIVRDNNGILVAFGNLWTTPDGSEVAIDLMRYSPSAAKGMMDFLFVEIALWAKHNGFARFDLGMAPLSGLDDTKGVPFLERLGAIMFEEGEALYGFAGLRQFKEKFSPNWEPLYLCAPPDVLMAGALFDVAALTSGGLRGMMRKT